jgi:hypothetical protein
VTRRRHANLRPLAFQEAALDRPQKGIDSGQTNEYRRPVTVYDMSITTTDTC